MKRIKINNYNEYSNIELVGSDDVERIRELIIDKE